MPLACRCVVIYIPDPWLNRCASVTTCWLTWIFIFFCQVSHCTTMSTNIFLTVSPLFSLLRTSCRHQHTWWPCPSLLFAWCHTFQTAGRADHAPLSWGHGTHHMPDRTLVSHRQRKWLCSSDDTSNRERLLDSTSNSFVFFFFLPYCNCLVLSSSPYRINKTSLFCFSFSPQNNNLFPSYQILRACDLALTNSIIISRPCNITLTNFTLTIFVALCINNHNFVFRLA